MSKHVLITGGPGFIAHHVVDLLVRNTDWKITTLDRLDFHSSRPGHDLRYGLDGGLMRSLGWEPKISLSERIKEVSDWYLSNPKWLGISDE